MTKRRIKNKWYMPKGWRSPIGGYRKIREEVRKHIRERKLRDRDSRS